MYNDVFRKNGKDYLRYYESTDSKYRKDLLESIEACDESVARYGADSSVAAAVTHMPLSADVDALPLMVIADSMGGVSLENYAKTLQNERDLALLLTQLHLFIDGPHSRFMKNVDWSINHVFVGLSTQELLIPVLPFAGVVSDMPKMMRFFEFLAGQVEISPARTSQLARDFVRFAIDLRDAKFFDVSGYLADVADRFEAGEDFEFVDYMASTTVLEDDSDDEVSQPNATTVLNWDENSALGWNETSIPAGGPGTTVLGMDSDILNGLDDWNPNGYRSDAAQTPSSNDWLPDEKLFGGHAAAPAGDTTVLGAVDADFSFAQPETQSYEYASTQIADVPSDANTAELSDDKDEAPMDLPSDKGTTVLVDPDLRDEPEAPMDVPSDKGTTVLVDPDAEAEAPVDLPSDKGTTVLVDPDAEVEAPVDAPSDKDTTVLPDLSDDEDFKAAAAIAAAVYDEGAELPSDQGTTVLEPRGMHAAPGSFDDDFEGNEIDEDSFAPEHAAGYDKNDKQKKGFFSFFGKHGKDVTEEDETEPDTQAESDDAAETGAHAAKEAEPEAEAEAEKPEAAETELGAKDDLVAAEPDVAEAAAEPKVSEPEAAETELGAKDDAEAAAEPEAETAEPEATEDAVEAESGAKDDLVAEEPDVAEAAVEPKVSEPEAAEAAAKVSEPEPEKAAAKVDAEPAEEAASAEPADVASEPAPSTADEATAEEEPEASSEKQESSSFFAGFPFFAKKSSDEDAAEGADKVEGAHAAKEAEPATEKASDEAGAVDDEPAKVAAADDADDKYGTTDDLTEKIPAVLAEEAEPPAPHKIRLVQNSNGRTAIIEPGVRFIVGKSKYSTFQVLNTNTVSRNHAVFTVDDDGRCWIEDDDSRNGTFIDNVRIDPHVPVQVKTGQTIRMSDVMFHIELA